MPQKRQTQWAGKARRSFILGCSRANLLKSMNRAVSKLSEAWMRDARRAFREEELALRARDGTGAWPAEEPESL